MSHHHEVQSGISFEEKLVKLLQHWIKHNEDHAGTYLEWINKPEIKDMKKVIALLEEASELTHQINKKFEEALQSLSS